MQYTYSLYRNVLSFSFTIIAFSYCVLSWHKPSSAYATRLSPCKGGRLRGDYLYRTDVNYLPRHSLHFLFEGIARI